MYVIGKTKISCVTDLLLFLQMLLRSASLQLKLEELLRPLRFRLVTLRPLSAL